MIPYDLIHVLKTRTRRRGKFKIKSYFVISTLTKYLNNTIFISVVDMGEKKGVCICRKQLCLVLYYSLGELPIIILYKYIIYMINLYKIHRICLKFRDFYFRALGSLVVLSFLQLFSFFSVLSKPLSETLTSVGTVGCRMGQQL
jgi:hypothetical protein